MSTGKVLFNTLLQELDDMGLSGMSATLDELYRSPKFFELDPLAAIAALVEPEYWKRYYNYPPIKIQKNLSDF